MRRVVKLGGTSLGSPELIRHAAQHLAALVERGEQVAVVVSAPGNATSELLASINAAGGAQLSFFDACSYLALGEEQSVHLMCAALRSYGVSALPFLPRERETWPLIADVEDVSPLAAGKVNEERPFKLRTQLTASRFSRFVLPHLRVGSVPVISGFFAVDSAGKVVALGRGGSDISAFIVATQVSADEVVIVTDVSGVLSADPRLAADPRVLDSLTLADMEIIAGAGARVVHPRALAFKHENLRARIIDYRELERLEETGTSVLGKSETTLFRQTVELSMLTLVGEVEDQLALQQALLGWITESRLPVTTASLGSRFTCLYFPSAVAEDAYRTLHARLGADFPELLNITLKGGVGELRLRSARFLDQPGVLAEVTGLLANAKINIIEMVTGLTDISVFIDYSELDRAETLLTKVLEHYAG